MDFFGFIVLGLLLLSTSSKVKKLSRKLKRLEKGSRGKEEMSALLKELVGKKCVLFREDDIVLGMPEPCHVLAVDDEWLKVTETNKKGAETTRIVRIDMIKELRIVEG